MVSVGVIYYVLVLGFSVSKYVKSSVTRACFFLVSLFLELCVLGTL